MNSYDFEDEYDFVPDQLTDAEIQEMQRLADLADQEASVPTAQERNPNLKRKHSTTTGQESRSRTSSNYQKRSYLTFNIY